MTLSDRIQRARLAAGFSSQKALADAIGVSRVSVTNWEAGLNEPSARRLRRLAELCGVTVDWLAHGAGPGPGGLAESDAADYDGGDRELQAVLDAFYPGRNDMFSLRVTSDAVEAAGVRAGDVILCERVAEPGPADVLVLTLATLDGGGETKLRVLAGGQFRPATASLRHATYDRDDPRLGIMGRIVRRWGAPKPAKVA